MGGKSQEGMPLAFEKGCWYGSPFVTAFRWQRRYPEAYFHSILIFTHLGTQHGVVES